MNRPPLGPQPRRLVIIPEPSADIPTELAWSLRASDGCKACSLSIHRQHVVPGEGSPSAQVALIGEAPGADEDEQGRPFVGRAGVKLTQLMTEAGLPREQAFILNAARCRPPGNRKPEPQELTACRGYLLATLAALPELKCLVLLGATSAGALLNDPLIKITRARGFWHELVVPADEAPHRVLKVLPTLHPSYALRNPNEEHLLRADLQVVARAVQEGFPTR